MLHPTVENLNDPRREIEWDTITSLSCMVVTPVHAHIGVLASCEGLHNHCICPISLYVQGSSLASNKQPVHC